MILVAVKKPPTRCHIFYHRVCSLASTLVKMAFLRKNAQMNQLHRRKLRSLASRGIVDSNLPVIFLSLWPIPFQKSLNSKHCVCWNSILCPTNNSIWWKITWKSNRFGCAVRWASKRKFQSKNWKWFCHHWRTILRPVRGVWCGCDTVTIRERISPVDTFKRWTIAFVPTRWRNK